MTTAFNQKICKWDDSVLCLFNDVIGTNHKSGLMTQFTLKKKNVTFFLDVVVIEVYLHAVQLYEMMIFMGANKIF